jgi:hypothetical protein
MRALLVILASLGIGLLTGGLLSFVFGAWIQRQTLFVTGLGPFNGIWGPPDYCFLGAVLASVGSALTACGLLGLRVRRMD